MTMSIFRKTRKAPKRNIKKSPSVAKVKKVFFEQMENRLLLDSVTAHWVGGSGNWSDPSHWDTGGVVPNDTASTTYQVVIDLASLDPTVTVDGNFKITGLTSSEILQVGSGGTLTASGAVTNTGQISSATGGTLKFENGTVQNTGHEILAAGGSVQLSNSTIKGGTLDDTIAGGDDLYSQRNLRRCHPRCSHLH
jgi:hypothetical protein